MADKTIEVGAAMRDLQQGYRDGTGNVRHELFDDVARAIGRSFASGGGDRTVSSSQIRGFYGDVKALEIKLLEMSSGSDAAAKGEIDEKVFGQNRYLVQMIVPKANYIVGKQTGGRVSQDFKTFIEAGIGTIQTGKDFTTFVRLFESVVGFFYGYGGGRNR